MSRARRVWLVALVSVVAGGLLLMHGLQPPGASAEHDGASVVENPVGHHPGSHASHASHASHGNHRSHREDASHGPTGSDEACDTCGMSLGHGALLCVAVVGSVLGLRLLRRFGVLLRRLGAAAVAATTSWWGEIERVLRPPRPAWVQLCVMRC